MLKWCENIFNKDGRNKIIKDSNVYVMTSEVNAIDYKKLQKISAFLKRDEFYHLVAGFAKKPNLFNGWPVKLISLI